MRSEQLTTFFGLLGIFLMLASLSVVVAITFIRKHANAERQKEELTKQYSQMLLQSHLEIKEQTLQFISNEVHDNLGQIASLIKINLNTLDLHNAAKMTEKIADTKELTRKLIADLKFLSIRLGTRGITQAGFVKALQQEVEYLNKTRQYKATISLEDNLPVFDNDKNIILFRMSQEILNNIVKHSRATDITISLKTMQNDFILAFHDNGIGMDLEKEEYSKGAGLLNLQERATLIQAKIIVESVPGIGTSVLITLPF